LDEGAADPFLSIGERVDCFEMSVSDGGLREHGKVNPVGEELSD
jgi:hypothetical protein